MKHIKVILLFGILLVSIACLPQNTKDLVIGELKDQSHVDGCGCYFTFLSGDKDVIQMETDTLVWMNINGIDQRFKLDNSTQTNEAYKVGMKWAEQYSNDLYTFQINYIVTSICSPDDENCEWTGMDATIILKQGNLKAGAKVRGGCGC